MEETTTVSIMGGLSNPLSGMATSLSNTVGGGFLGSVSVFVMYAGIAFLVWKLVEWVYNYFTKPKGTVDILNKSAHTVKYYDASGHVIGEVLLR